MIISNLPPFPIRPKSLLAKHFELDFRIAVDKVNRNIAALPLTALIWGVERDRLKEHPISEFITTLEKLDISVVYPFPKEISSADEALENLEFHCTKVDMVFAFIFQDALENNENHVLVKHLIEKKDTLSEAMFICVDNAFENELKKENSSSRLNEKEIWTLSELVRPETTRLIAAIRTIKYFKKKNIRSSIKTLSRFYEYNKPEIDLFLHCDYLLLLSFIRYIQGNQPHTKILSVVKTESIKEKKPIFDRVIDFILSLPGRTGAFIKKMFSAKGGKKDEPQKKKSPQPSIKTISSLFNILKQHFFIEESDLLAILFYFRHLDLVEFLSVLPEILNGLPTNLPITEKVGELGMTDTHIKDMCAGFEKETINEELDIFKKLKAFHVPGNRIQELVLPKDGYDTNEDKKKDLPNSRTIFELTVAYSPPFLNRIGTSLLTGRGEDLFGFLGLTSLPVLVQEKKHFKEKWNGKMPWPALSSTHWATAKTFGNMGKLNGLLEKYYFSMKREYFLKRKLRFFINRHLFEWTTEEQDALWESDVGKELYKIWKENIGTPRSGFEAELEERTDFFEYLYALLKIKHEPENKEIYENMRMSIYGLRYLRPNPLAIIFATFSFGTIHLKSRVKQYFELAVKTGEFDILLKRFPPYNHLLNLYAAPGDRIFTDTRVIDFTPVTYKLDLKLSVALEFDNVPTRSNNRFISAKIEKDQDLEANKKALIKKLEDTVKFAFPSPAYLMNFDFGEDGLIYLMENGKKKEVIPQYGPRRANFIQTNGELTLVKSIPVPGPKSSIVIRFNLLDPVAVLCNGIEGVRQISIPEIIRVMKCHQLMGGGLGRYRSIDDAIAEADKNPGMDNLNFASQLRQKKEQDPTQIQAWQHLYNTKISEIIDQVFDNPECPNIPVYLARLINRLEDLRKEDPTEESAWEFLTPILVKGGDLKSVVQTINHCLVGDGFEFVFSIWPLITGRQITIDKEGGKIEESDDTSREVVNKDLLPLLDILKVELEHLLKDVFTRHVDISAATKRYRSEPELIGLILEACLYPKNDKDEIFRQRIEDHLKNHYNLHHMFLKEYLPFTHLKDPNDNLTSLHDINRLKTNLDELCANDSREIMNLVHKTRNRLVRREENNRVLRYIDPKSLTIEIKDLEYSGAIEKEDAFLEKNIELQNGLGSLIKGGMTKKKETQLKTGAHEFIAGLEIKQAETDVKKIKHEIQVQAFRRLEEGKMKDYAQLILFEAYLDNGVERMEQVLKDSPNLLMAIYPKVHEMQEADEMKKNLFRVLDKNPELLTPLTTAMILEENVEEIAASQIYQKFNQDLVNVLEISSLFGKSLPRDFKGIAQARKNSQKDHDENEDHPHSK